MDGCAGNRRSGLQVFLNNLGFEGFRISASLAHRNPEVKGDRIRFKYADIIVLNGGVRKVCWLQTYMLTPSPREGRQGRQSLSKVCMRVGSARLGKSIR